MIDEWEEQIARGEVPDLSKAFNKEALESIKNRKTSKFQEKFTGSIADTYKAFEAERVKNESQFAKSVPTIGPTFKKA